MQGGPAAEDLVHLIGRECRDRRGVERHPDLAESLLQHQRRREGELHRHLLVEEHADQERERISREQAIRSVIRRERQRVDGHGPISHHGR